LAKSVALPGFSKAMGKSANVGYDEIAALAGLTIHLEQLPLPLESGKWIL
jgi:hypothetical protein